MAKSGFLYYNTDTDRYQDTKIKRLKKKFSCSGIAVYDYILNCIYMDKGCYASWGSDENLDVADYFNIEEEQVCKIVEYCLEVGLFDAGKYRTEGVLTSKSIQERFVEMSVKCKRKNAAIPEKIAILPEETPNIPEETPKTTEELNKERIERIEEKEEDDVVGKDISLAGNNFKKPSTATPTSDAIQSGYKPKVPIPTVDIMQEVLKESSDERYWINAVAEQHHLSQKQVRELIPKFVVHLASDGVTQKTTEDFKKHFNAWIRKKAEFGEASSSSEAKPPTDAVPSSREKIRQMKELRNNFDFGDVGSALAKQDRN